MKVHQSQNLSTSRFDVEMASNLCRPFRRVSSRYHWRLHQIMGNCSKIYLPDFECSCTIQYLAYKYILIMYLYGLTAHNWQKWNRVFLTCPCHKIYRDEAVGLISRNYTWKITIFVKMWNLGQYRENLKFCQ